MNMEGFHPAVAAWFERRFGVPTPAQAEAWPAIRAGGYTLVAARTASGKTLVAFLAAIEELVRGRSWKRLIILSCERAKMARRRARRSGLAF